MDLRETLKTLRDERNRLNAAIAALETLAYPPAEISRVGDRRGNRGPRTPEQKRKHSDAMKSAWARKRNTHKQEDEAIQ